MSFELNQARHGAAKRPSLTLLGTEPWRAGIEYVAHLMTAKPAASSGDGHPVIIFPGLASDGLAVRPLRDYCRALGYNAFDWGQGFNTGPSGDVDAWLEDLAAKIRARLQRQPQAATFIGWSLGGIYARELAKRSDLAVRQVITIGTPFNGTSQQTHAGWVYRLLSGSVAPDHAEWQRRFRRPPTVPTTSIYSRTDGIVAWQACVNGPQFGPVEDIEVKTSHLGMGWNPKVLAVVGDRLAQVPGHWRPYGSGQPQQQRRPSDPLSTARP